MRWGRRPSSRGRRPPRDRLRDAGFVGRQTSARTDRQLPPSSESWRGRNGRSVGGRAGGPGSAQGGVQTDQVGNGHQGGTGPIRVRAAGPGADEPPQHRQGLRGGLDRRGPALLRHGVCQGSATDGVLRRPTVEHTGAPGPLHSGLRWRTARPPEGCHPSRHQTVEYPGCGRGRPSGSQNHRFWCCQGDLATTDRTHPLHRARPVDRYSRVHESGTGGAHRARCRHPVGCLFSWRCAVRAARRDPAVRCRRTADGGL